MFEARAFVEDLQTFKKKLEELNAEYKGDYDTRDVIYRSKDESKDLADEFLRLRIHTKQIWSEKDFIVAVKQTKTEEVGKHSVIPVKEEFETEEAARQYIDDNLIEHFEYDFEFSRLGWQFDLDEDQIDLEEVKEKPLYTVELKSPTVDGLKKLCEIFGVTETITGPSVVAVKERL